MPSAPPPRPRHHIQVVLSSAALLPFVSVRKAAAPAIAELGAAAFCIAGVTGSVLGSSAGWFVAAAAVFASLVRAIDVESWALLLPGGLMARAAQAFDGRTARTAAALALVERAVLAALACVIVGQYVAGVAVVSIAEWRFTRFVRQEDLATLLAVATIGFLWLRVRMGRELDRETLGKAVWVGVGILSVTVLWGLATIARAEPGAVALAWSLPAPVAVTGWSFVDAALTWLVGFALALPTIGGGQALARGANELPPPRVLALRRTALLTVIFALVITAGTTFLVLVLVPPAEQALWLDAPLAALAQNLVGPPWARDVMAVALACAAALVLVPAACGALTDAERVLYRFSADGTPAAGLTSLHARFGTPTRVIDVCAAVIVLITLVSAGRVAWLARVYGIAIAALLVLTVAVLARLRRRAPAGSALFTAPINLRLGARQVPLGLLGAGLIVAASTVTMVAIRDPASLAAAALIGAVAIWFGIAGRHTEPAHPDGPADTFDVLASADLSPDHVDARPGNVLVPVRNPHALAHVKAALEAAGDRDVVVMTVRLFTIDGSTEAVTDTVPTQYERQLLSEVVAIAERMNRPVRLLIVPARGVVDAIVATVLRLRSSEIYVGESATLSAADQARLLGEAWERFEKPEPLDVRLVIGHRSGRLDTYHLGAHPPSLAPKDLELIHRVWLDAVKAIGPHVHHHDIVRAALTQMEQQLDGPNRDEALTVIRSAAQPAEELAAVLQARDYARLRDMMRNRHSGEVATLLTALSLEEQVVVFRVLPRKDAAAVFEYLSQDQKESLLKAMAKEDVAVLLNNMAPDDRTMFLEELPAAATRELLALLTPEERQVALTLLGYPEKSVGRLMTPHYVAAREDWTVREVLDYVREHGRDSETLNVLYVVNDQGVLIDDVRIREFLLAPLDHRVADLMDRRFVALTAADNQEAAVAVFRQYDRSALPVTDTTGVLIGIVTIDDVLDVAEATATREIQRIGGSEALDEPYVQIAFWRMIQKRAGWLTALFLGEMLTATAMGFFEAEIEKAVVLALFVPLIISSGGNSGSQAATLVIRAMALGEVGLRDWWFVMRRELLAGVSLGAILGGIGFLRITLWSAFSDLYGPHWFLIAVTVTLSLVGVVLWGTLTGSLMPLLMRRLGFDPAASSAPFVATLVDVTGLVIYFSIALVVLQGTVL